MKILGDFVPSERHLTLFHEGIPTTLRLRFTKNFEDFVFRFGSLPPASKWELVSDRHDDLPLVIGISDAIDPPHGPALIGCTASHKRQRIQIDLCRGAKILVSGNYGRSVIAICEVDALLVFQHRDYQETVFFDGDRLIRNTRKVT